MKQINLNSQVKVKLTEEGIKILESNHNCLLKQYGGGAKAKKLFGEFIPPQVDENGYSFFQLWVLMNTFGNYMYNGNMNPPFEMNIIIEDQYLEKVEPKILKLSKDKGGK